MPSLCIIVKFRQNTLSDTLILVDRFILQTHTPPFASVLSKQDLQAIDLGIFRSNKCPQPENISEV